MHRLWFSVEEPTVVSTLVWLAIVTEMGVGVSTLFFVAVALVLDFALFIAILSVFLDVHLKVAAKDVPPIAEQDISALQGMLSQIRLWAESPNFDGVNWLDTLAVHLLPYLEKALCKGVKDELLSEFKVDSEAIGALTLGSLVMYPQGTKIYNAEEKEMTIDLSLKWAGNPHFRIDETKFWVKSTFQIIAMEISVLPRITLKALGPHKFSRILVTFMEKPRVDCEMEVVVGGPPVSCASQFLLKSRIEIPTEE